jgi:hypothetical protein
VGFNIALRLLIVLSHTFLFIFHWLFVYDVLLQLGLPTQLSSHSRLLCLFIFDVIIANSLSTLLPFLFCLVVALPFVKKSSPIQVFARVISGSVRWSLFLSNSTVQHCMLSNGQIRKALSMAFLYRPMSSDLGPRCERTTKTVQESGTSQ